jgi:hypothetical protein
VTREIVAVPADSEAAQADVDQIAAAMQAGGVPVHTETVDGTYVLVEDHTTSR